MALIEISKMTQISKRKNTVHQSVKSTYTIFVENGKRYIQIDTYGTDERQVSDKSSQSFQLDESNMQLFIKLLHENIHITDHKDDHLPVSVKIDTIPARDAISKIKTYIASRGFTYPDGLIENFYLCLKTKPFVILAGTSGTGKTRLVKLFAEAIGATCRPVAVRPDWSDGSDLFGHRDLNGNFVRGPVCECFEEAYGHPDRPVFLCLDEMNLARVEHYMSDVLSVIESREWRDGRIATDGIAQYDRGIPDNLYVVGTVNMDETTFPFSRKVLDRANTIEFSHVDLMPDFDGVGAEPEPLDLPNGFLRADYLVLARDCAEERDAVDAICGTLQELNGILAKADAHVGYRVRDEIVFYMLNNGKAGLLPEDRAMDNQIMQKILPRIQGSSSAVRTLLIDLFTFCMKERTDMDTGDAAAWMRSEAASAKYPSSAAKIASMAARFEEDGFASFWI